MLRPRRSPSLVRAALCAGVLTLISVAGFGCSKPDPAEQCRAACEKVTSCGHKRLIEGLDCANNCRNVKTFSECPSCLAGMKASCEDIATARVCGASCRAR